MTPFILAIAGGLLGLSIGVVAGIVAYRKQMQAATKLAEDGIRQYGPEGTIHKTTHVDVETYKGQVVSVWFRCQRLPFKQSDVDTYRANELDSWKDEPSKLLGVIVKDENRVSTGGYSC